MAKKKFCNRIKQKKSPALYIMDEKKEWEKDVKTNDDDTKLF